MHYNDEQFTALSKYEEHFTTAVNARWSRYPGSAALDEIHSIYCAATGDKRKNNKSCSTCILNLLIDCGRLYFQDKTAREAEPKRVRPLKKRSK